MTGDDAASLPPGPRLDGSSNRWQPVLPLAAAIALGLAALAFVWLCARPLAILLLGITLAESVSPLVDLLSARVPRTAAILLIYVACAAVVAVLVWLLIPTLVDESQQLAAQLPDLLQALRHSMNQWDHSTGGQVSRAVAATIQQSAASLVALPLDAASALFVAILTVFLSLYWLLEQPRLRRFTLSLFSDRQRSHAAEVLAAMGDAVGGYVRGVVIDAMIMGALAWLALLLAGIRYPVMLGGLTMAGELIPYVGPIVAGVAATGVGLTQSPEKGLIALALYIALEQLEGHIVTPNVMRSQTSMSPVLVLFAFLTGATVGGPLGTIVALPLAAVLRVAVLQILLPIVRHRAL